MTSISLSDEPILITGALGSLARFIVQRLAEAGALLLLTDLLPAKQAWKQLEEWKIPLSQLAYRELDVTQRHQVEGVVGELLTQHPDCKIVLGHAGGCALHPFASTPPEAFESVMRFNFLAQTYLARAVLSFWRTHKNEGHLIFTSSYVACAPHAGIPAYAAAKGALEVFARCLALEYASDRIRVNCLAPGNVAAGSSLRVYDQDPTYRGFVDRVTPFGGRNTPEAIADALLFLCSPLAREMNGQVLRVDRGICIPKIG
jgi:NAD(P)-dependent dehydrogenase (short-subunit alcohol dehydrogenase family)